ncbi:methyltransferase domain-containing protein [Pedobacter sp. SL55]|uniref:methyltransferase domain-containing protein n=1 Tax=Pedobacter sp. SL55 TaxID=2995161 RepID=UPI0022710B02|nr:methyltransferase domain-containing protein [Pedobacter sp. SL55]WAC42444.1 methyltransferase domain-containing protein [Pedobacter sp. SL55]
MQQTHPLDQSFWNSRWENQQTGWDIGMASPAIITYMAQYTNKDAAILIPGCGNAHEANWLLQNGFTNITLIDIAPKAVAQLQQKYAKNPSVKIILGDFFEHKGQYDLMIEQTFFCAIDPKLRQNYVAQAASLLKENGQIIGLLFNVDFQKQGPPFGGNTIEYQTLFEKYFSIKKLEDCYNSIKPRTNTEVFINFVKK